MPHAPSSFVTSPGIVGAILDEVRREADKVFGPCSGGRGRADMAIA
jgi:hypothetical protein